LTSAGTELADVIPAGAGILVDTSATLAYVTGTESASPAATHIFDAFLATGRNVGYVSMVSVGELLVRPFRAGPAAIATIEGLLRHFAEIRLVNVTYEIAREAARLRAASDLRMPDALIIATALEEKVDVLVTNDRSWPAALTSVAPGLPVCVLSDVIPSR